MSIMKGISLKKEMKKNSQLKLSNIQLLREWCEKQPHLPKIEDNFLALFLHANYYQMEPTKNKIENYYTIRTHLPELFCDRDPLRNKELRQAFKVVGLFPLNGETKEGYKIIYGTFLNDDPAHYNFNSTTKFSMMLYDLCCLMHGTNNGYVYVCDVSKVSFGHMSRLSLLGLKKSLYYIQEAAPIRLKGIHIINSPPVMEIIMKMIKPFIKKEILDLIHFHSSLKSVSEYIPVDLLPNETGGKAGSIHELAKIQVKQLEDYREWFLLDEATRRVNETLRIGISMSVNNLFDVKGNLKKPDIDK